MTPIWAEGSSCARYMQTDFEPSKRHSLTDRVYSERDSGILLAPEPGMYSDSERDSGILLASGRVCCQRYPDRDVIRGLGMQFTRDNHGS
jgi:hypothetical protein